MIFSREITTMLTFPFRGEGRGSGMMDTFLPPYPDAPPSAGLGALSPALSLSGSLCSPICIPAPQPQHQLWASVLAPQIPTHTDATCDTWNIISLPLPPKKIPSHLQDSISGFSWNVVKICVFAMGTFRSRGLGGSSYKTVCLKLYFCTKWIFIRPVNAPLMCVSEPERSKAPCGKCSHPPPTFVLSPNTPQQSILLQVDSRSGHVIPSASPRAIPWPPPRGTSEAARSPLDGLGV